MQKILGSKMNNRKKEIINLLIYYSDIIIILISLNILFKIIELIWYNYLNISTSFLYSIFFLIPFIYFLYRLYNNSKINKSKASNLIVGLLFFYIISNIFIESSIDKTDFVAITSNISNETDFVTYGDGQEQEVHVNPFKEEGLFNTNDKEFNYYLNNIKSKNEVVTLQNFNYYQTGIIFGNKPINFQPKEYIGNFGIVKKSFSYSYYLLKDLILLSFRNFIASLIILTLFQLYKQKKNKGNLLTPVYYTDLFKK